MSLVLSLWEKPPETRTNCCYWKQLPLWGEGPLLGDSERMWEGARPPCLVQPPRDLSLLADGNSASLAMEKQLYRLWPKCQQSVGGWPST